MYQTGGGGGSNCLCPPHPSSTPPANATWCINFSLGNPRKKHVKSTSLGAYPPLSCTFLGGGWFNIYIYTIYIFKGVMSQLMEAITMTVSGFKPNCISQIPWRSHPKSDQTGPDLDVHPVLPSDFRARFPACMCVCARAATEYRGQWPVGNICAMFENIGLKKNYVNR